MTETGMTAHVWTRAGVDVFALESLVQQIEQNGSAEVAYADAFGPAKMRITRQ